MNALPASSTSWDSPTIAMATSRSAIEALRQAVSLDERCRKRTTFSVSASAIVVRASRRNARCCKPVELEPTFAAAREELVTLYTDSGRHRQAIEQLEALSALEPTRPERLVSVGLAYARLGRRDAAVLTLGRAAERHPDSTIVYTALGRVWLEAAERDDDRVALNKALEALAPVAEQPECDERGADHVWPRAVLVREHSRRGASAPPRHRAVSRRADRVHLSGVRGTATRTRRAGAGSRSQSTQRLSRR